MSVVPASDRVYGWTQRGQAAAQALPPMLVKAERVAATVILGVHGRKRAGPGESFWQYRPYSFGDPTQRIDWRRSAISDRVYIRENEWEAANTLWVWTSASPRMNFKSAPVAETKQERAQILGLAMASLAVRAHERLGGLGSPRSPGYGKSALHRLAEWMLSSRADELPKPQRLQRQSAAVLLSDFLDPVEDIAKSLRPLAEAGIMGHLVQIYDPAEETFPYEGRIEFVGLDRPQTYLAPKSQSLKTVYGEKYRAHNDNLRTLARQLGWSIMRHSTDAPVQRALMALYGQVSDDRRAKGLAA